MRSPSDPIRSAWIQTLSIGGVGLVACIAVSLWAFSPVQRASVDPDWRPKLDTPEPAPETDVHAEQIAVYGKRLWTPPEKPVEIVPDESASAPPPPPPRLVLLGIVSPAESGSSGYEAILYDPDTDTVHIARSGATIGSVTLGSVTSETAVIVTSQGEAQLRLDTGRQQADQG